MNVGIVGLGLIGGSMARSIKQKAEDRVLGFDIDQETLDMAIMCRAVDAVLDDDSIPSCSLILLAVRPGAAVDWVREKAGLISTDAVVIDLCGIKRKVVSEITPVAEKYGFSYIGGHPMAGKEVNGFENSSADLFSGASMILTPDRHTSLPLLEKLKKFFIGIGFARLTFTTPEDHDRIIAYTSQLAHISSSAYTKSPEAQERRGFSAGSFRDMTRVARLDENIWTELFLDNADNLTSQLELFISNLSEYLDALRAGDAEKLRALLRDGREKKETAGGR